VKAAAARVQTLEAELSEQRLQTQSHLEALRAAQAAAAGSAAEAARRRREAAGRAAGAEELALRYRARAQEDATRRMSGQVEELAAELAALRAAAVDPGELAAARAAAAAAEARAGAAARARRGLAEEVEGMRRELEALQHEAQAEASAKASAA
jgi:hypothetical protein